MQSSKFGDASLIKENKKYVKLAKLEESEEDKRYIVKVNHTEYRRVVCETELEIIAGTESDAEEFGCMFVHAEKVPAGVVKRLSECVLEEEDDDVEVNYVDLEPLGLVTEVTDRDTLDMFYDDTDTKISED